MHRVALTIVAIYWPENESLFITTVGKEVTGDATLERTDVFHSHSQEVLWEEGKDLTLRLQAQKAIESFVQRSRLDSPM